MPIRERLCPCGTDYEVIVYPGSDRAVRAADGREPAVCPDCGGGDYTTVFNTDFAAVGLGGDAGVGKHFPYYDRALGPGKDGRGILVRDAAHRRHLLTHEPNGRKRASPLIPLESTSDSALRGTWDDIADRDAAERDADAKVYADMVKEMEEGPNREAYAKAKEAAAAAQATLATGGPDATATPVT